MIEEKNFSMKTKRKKKVLSDLKLSEKSRRDSEIKQYGRILSLRPSKVMSGKKDYKRKWRLEDESED